MRRLGKTPLALGLAAALVVGSAVPLVNAHWDTLRKHGGELGMRKQAERFLRPDRTGAPLVLAIGDSTLRPPIPFSTQMGARMRSQLEVRTFWGAGMSPAEAALMASAALELEPDAMLLLAHFAAFQAPHPLRFPQLARLVPPKRLPALLALPFSTRGLGAGELVFGSLTGALVPQSWLRASVGGPRWFQEELTSRWGVSPGSDLYRAIRTSQIRLGAVLNAADPVGPGHPSVEFLRGNVAMIERAGTEVLVVISPVNEGPLVKHGVYDPAAMERRVQLVTERVESAGGDVLDMHDALPPEEFADELGHYTTTGARRISLPVEDWTRKILGLPPREED